MSVDDPRAVAVVVSGEGGALRRSAMAGRKLAGIHGEGRPCYSGIRRMVIWYLCMQFINASSSRAVDVQEVVRTFSPCFGPPSKSFAHKELEGSP